MSGHSLDLKEFCETLQGRMVQRVLRQALRRFWPSVKGLRVLGLGYATPYLRSLMGEAERVAHLTPAGQDIAAWPTEGPSLSALCDGAQWPIETNSVDRIFAVHAPDGPAAEVFLDEAWRVLAGQGRILLVAPNRSGIWARLDSNPFGHGAPWSLRQLRALLKRHGFVPERSESVLFFPPSDSRLWLLTAPVFEKIGRRAFGAFGGVWVVEASKQIYAGTPVGVTAAARRRPVAATAPRPLSRDGG